MNKSNVCLAVAVSMLAACASQPVSEEQQKMAARQLLLPYLQQRTVLCNELDVTITPNFHANVSNPGVDKQRHQFERSEEDGVVTKVWTNTTGTRAGMFTVTIGERPDPTDVSGKPLAQTTFLVLNEFRLHTRGGEWAITAKTTGPILAVTEANATREVREFAIADGVVTRR